MDSSDDEDIHQCGRCKAIFHSIETYFTHKKDGKCERIKHTVIGNETANEPGRKTARKQLSTVSRDDPEALEPEFPKFTAIDNRKPTVTLLKQKKTAGKRGRPRKIQPSTKVDDTEIKYIQKKKAQQFASRNATLASLRDRGKITPKKKWVDTFEEATGRECTSDYSGDDDSSLPGEIFKRRRGRPPKSTTYGHILKPARPYQKEHTFSCPECDHVTNQQDEYDRHLRVFHKLSTYVCVNCHLPFGDKYKLRRHQEKKICAKDVDPSVPTPQFMQFKPSNRIYRHPFMDSEAAPNNDESKSPEPTQKGKKGTKVADKTGIELEKNNDEEDDKSTYNCSDLIEFNCLECDEKFITFAEISDHLVHEHPTVVPGICEFCGKWFSSKYRLWRHMTSSVHDHLSPEQLDNVKGRVKSLKVNWKASDKQKRERYRKYNCVKCKQMFYARALYLQHMKKIHNPSEMSQKHICDWCGMVMICSLAAFHQHVEEAHNVKARDSYCTCTVCSKTFHQKSHVMRHKETLHTPIKQVPTQYLPDPGQCFTVSSSSAETHEELTKTEGEVQQPSNVDEPLGSALARVYTCFVCCSHFEEQSTYREHMELHRVWVADTDRDGPFPRDLFTSATHRSLTLSSESSTAANYKKAAGLDIPKKGEESEGELTIECDPDQSSMDVMDQDDMDILDDDQTETSKVLKMIMQLGEGRVDDSLSTHYMTRRHKNVKPVEKETEKVDTAPVSSRSVVSSRNDGHREDVVDFLRLEGGEDGDESSAMIQNPTEDNERERKEFHCAYCAMMFDDIEQRYLHLVEYHKLKAVFRCVMSICAEVMNKLEDYIAHSKTHNQRAFICNLCNEHVSNMSLLLAHRSVVHRNGPHNDNKCGICKATFPDWKELEHHLMIADLVHFPCNACGRILRSHEEMETHKQMHSDVKAYLCEECGMGFGNSIALRRHRACHNHSRVHKCTECEASFKKREHLLRHTISKHSNLKPFICETCNKSFKRRDKLLEHQRTHLMDKPFVCKQCGIGYRYREGLKYHEKTHDREVKYPCLDCSIYFTRPGQLKTHLLEKHNTKTRAQHLYPCSMCTLTFSRPERVRRHMERIHKASINWQAICQVCNKGFPGEKSLNTHMTKVHTALAMPRPDSNINVQVSTTRNQTENILASFVNIAPQISNAAGSQISESSRMENTTASKITIQSQLPVVDHSLMAVPPPVLTISADQLARTPVSEVQSLYRVFLDQNMSTTSSSTSVIETPPIAVGSSLLLNNNGNLTTPSSRVIESAPFDLPLHSSSSLTVSKANAITSTGVTDPVTVFMYLHPPVQAASTTTRQPVVIQSATNMDIPLPESQISTITMDIQDLVNNSQPTAITSQTHAASYMSSFDQSVTMSQASTTIPASTVLPGTFNQCATGSQTTSQCNLDYAQQFQSDLKMQTKKLVNQLQPITVASSDAAPKQSQLISQAPQGIESYRINLSENSATQQLLQLISLEALHSATPSSSSVHMGNSSQTALSVGSVSPTQATNQGAANSAGILPSSGVQTLNVQDLLELTQGSNLGIQFLNQQLYPSSQQQTVHVAQPAANRALLAPNLGQNQPNAELSSVSLLQNQPQVVQSQAPLAPQELQLTQNLVFSTPEPTQGVQHSDAPPAQTQLHQMQSARNTSAVTVAPSAGNRGLAQLGQVRNTQIQHLQTNTQLVSSCYAASSFGQVMSEQVLPGQVMLGHLTPGPSMPERVTVRQLAPKPPTSLMVTSGISNTDNSVLAPSTSLGIPRTSVH